MSAFHKDSVTSLENNNNNIPSGSKSSKSSRSRNNNSSNEKVHPCQYCKKSFVSPAKLRLHTAKFHAEERLNEVHPPPPPELSGGSLEAGPGGQDPVKLALVIVRIMIVFFFTVMMKLLSRETNL